MARVQPSDCTKPGPLPRLTRRRVLARVREIAPSLAAASAEIDAERRLPEPMIDALIERGLLRMLLPRSLGGAELPPAEYVPVIEELAKTDASAAWCVNQNSGCSMTAVHLKPEIAREIFGGKRGILAWGPGPARRDRSGRLSGHRDLGLHQRRPARDLARLPCAGDRGRRKPRRHPMDAGRAHDAVPEKRDRIHRYVAHDRAARHRQQPVFGQGSVRAGGLFGRCLSRRAVPTGQPAYCTASAICSSMRPGSPGWRSASAARRSNISSSWPATRSRAARRRRCATTT